MKELGYVFLGFILLWGCDAIKDASKLEKKIAQAEVNAQQRISSMKEIYRRYYKEEMPDQTLQKLKLKVYGEELVAQIYTDPKYSDGN